jgi:hypothetical protein
MTFQKSKFLSYIVSYKEAGDRIVESILENRAYENELKLPICHLYCHYVELSLKNLIFLGNQLLSTPIQWSDENSRSAGFPSKTHNLIYLQNKCIEILTQLNAESVVMMPDIDMNVLDVCIHKLLDISNLDIDSFGYRYPVNTKGEQILPDEYNIDVNDLRDTISRIDTLFFDETMMVLNDLLSNKRPDYN